MTAFCVMHPYSPTALGKFYSASVPYIASSAICSARTISSPLNW